MINYKNLIFLIFGFIFFNNLYCMQDYIGENITPEEARRIEEEQVKIKQEISISNITDPENIFKGNPSFISSQINTFLLSQLDIFFTESLNLSYSSVTEKQVLAILNNFQNLKNLNIKGCVNLTFNFIEYLKSLNFEILIYDQNPIIRINNLPEGRSLPESDDKSIEIGWC
ncbi:hypothetical protein K9L05_02755 [Candidatus Babeliales bacterium]|nr:hypothetical protein [Candidatus Babeliales bacterium]MCF7899546.1 hypothetical protein [Candidatus Babeliales bacterium]